jgi:3'-5' exonuclease
MFKTIGKRIWAFDLEWVPDPDAGRRVYDLPNEMSDTDVILEMWKKGGATEENPQPYIKTVLCRVVSVVVVSRECQGNGEIKLDLRALPKANEPLEEAMLIAKFFTVLGKEKPQLVGFNSSNSDLPILIQRGVAKGVTAPEFCKRPLKPWNGTDYFAKSEDAHVDLKDVLGGWGKATPSLHEIAEVSGIPGKIGTTGHDVLTLWTAGTVREIVEYNEFDALTTYLVWLRTARFAGFFSNEEYHQEENRVRDLLNDRIGQGNNHLKLYLDRWESLKR